MPRALAPTRLPSSISTEADLVKYRKFNGNQFYQPAWHGTLHRFERYNQIIGEQGASRLDNAKQVRADLTTAREMETAGKDAQVIGNGEFGPIYGHVHGADAIQLLLSKKQGEVQCAF